METKYYIICKRCGKKEYLKYHGEKREYCDSCKDKIKDESMRWINYTDKFGNKVRVSQTTGDFQVKMAFWGWMGSFKGEMERRYLNGDLYVGGVYGSLYHGKGKKIWKETGNSYEGDWVYHHQTGKGKFVWGNGGYYEGDFVDGNFNGRGVRMYNDGCRYEGQFKENKRHGRGKMFWPNGDTYEGDWNEDFRTGKGKYVWGNGGYYEGDFVDGDFNGRGVRMYNDGCRYEGQFKEDKRHGRGKMFWPNGDTYEGDWNEDSRTGKGKYVWPDNGYYEGDFVNGKIHGNGIRVFGNGVRYEGQFKQDKCHGNGRMLWPLGDTYDGNWNEGLREGKGKYTWPNNGYYIGDFAKGKIEGSGIRVLGNGDRYEGQYKQEKYHGKGKLIHLDGSVDEGYFENGKFVRAIEPSSQANGPWVASVSNLQTVINNANDGDTVVLNEDVEATSIIIIAKNITINGNGHKVTSNADRVFRIDNSNIEVTLNDVNIVSNAVRVSSNDIRGISINPSLTGIKITLNNCSVDFSDESAHDLAYAVNVAGDGSGQTIIINGGIYEGDNVINVHGTANTVIVKNATLTSLYLPNEDMYGACIWVQQDVTSRIEATGNIFNGDNAVAIDAGCTPTIASNNTDNTTMSE